MTQSIDLNKEQVSQLENFLNVLVDLDIIELPKQATYRGTNKSSRKNKNVDETIEFVNFEPIEKLVCNAYLESSFLGNSNSNSNYTVSDNQDSGNGDFEDASFMSEASHSSNNESHIANTLEQSCVSCSNSETQSISFINTNQISVSNKTNLDTPEETIAAFERLQDILVGAELAELNTLTNHLKQNLSKLETQIYQPKELINLLLPTIAEVIKLKIADSKDDFVEAVTPIVDRVIQNRVEQDRDIMGSAIASAVPPAIIKQIQIAPEEVANAIAPTMGEAIKKQIEIEQDKIVDALYPIIGSTISKYMGETIQAINQQIEDTLSVEGIQRKISAKLQGVSEAELILRQALPFRIQAIFLIHKSSGLVISDIQRSDTERLEPDMLAGMLTAIRSFANDCIAQSGTASELNAIDYGSSKIILEVAGYCYLAIVIQGEAKKQLISSVRQALTKIVKNYGKPIEIFDGDPSTIPTQIHSILEELVNKHSHKEKSKYRLSPLTILTLTILSAIMIPFGIWRYHSGVIQTVENKTSSALASTPELAVYRLTVQENKGKLRLTGKVPNQPLRDKAEQVAREAAFAWTIDNQITAVEIPADPVLAEAEVKRITEVLNQVDGIAITTQYIDGKTIVEGIVNRNADAKKINQAFEQIPGVKLVSSTVKVQPLRIDIRFYFEVNSPTLQPKDLGYKLQQVKLFLNQQPKRHLKIVGYSNSSFGGSTERTLALQRAITVKQALINQGIDPSRLHIVGSTDLPPGVDANQPDWLKRCVLVEPIEK